MISKMQSLSWASHARAGWTVLLLAGMAAPLGACSSTSSARSKVQRAPWIVLGEATAVAVRPGQLKCLDVTYGPDEVWQDVSKEGGVDLGILTANMSVKKKVPRTRVTPCSDGVMQHVEQRVRQVIAANLQAAGKKVAVDTVPEAELTYDITVRRVVSVSPEGEHKDTKDSHICQQRCGRNTCNRYEVDAFLDFDSTFRAPPVVRDVAEGAERNADFSSLVTRYPEDSIHYLCDIRDAEKLLGWNKINHGMALRNLDGWLGKALDRMLRPYSEEYDTELFDISDDPHNESGLRAAKASKWKIALAEFQRAFEAAQGLEEPDRELEAKLRHNMAAAQMNIGDLGAASEMAALATADADNDETTELRREIERRQTDAERMQAIR